MTYLAEMETDAALAPLQSATVVALVPRLRLNLIRFHGVLAPISSLHHWSDLYPWVSFTQIAKKSLKPTLSAAGSKTNLRISGDFPVRLTTKPFPSTCGSYEKGRLFFLYSKVLSTTVKYLIEIVRHRSVF